MNFVSKIISTRDLRFPHISQSYNYRDDLGDPVTPAPIRRSEPNSVVTAEWRGDQHAGGEQEYPGLQSYHETEMVSEPGTETLM